jgi:Cu/Ag efflux pump CusA
MIERIVRFVLRAPAFAIMFAVTLAGVGIYSYTQLNIEAYPNPVPPMVELIAQPPGWSAEETELYVTHPLEVGLFGMPGLDHVRSQSLFGLSDVKCYFQWGTDYKEARQEVINRLQFVTLPSATPGGPPIQAQISPWNAIGELFRYTVEGKGYTLKELKTAEDWILERQWRMVPGVVDVTSFGGETKQFHIKVDPYRLKGHGVTLTQLTAAIQNANINGGGQRLEIGEQSYDIRGVGLLRNTHDIEDIVIVDYKGTPVRVKDVAEVEVGFAPRLGMVGIDDQPDVVQGIVLMRYGAETKSTLAGIHAKVDYIEKNHILPPGMHIKAYYDRGDLVGLTTHTVMENVGIGIALVALVLLLFLGHIRAALITAVTIPLALLGAFTGLVFSHTSANLISIGAIDFGIVVDSSVIMMENIFRHLGSHGRGSMRQRILAAAQEVGTPMAFSTLIIGSSFLPLFTMTGVSGVIFSPMARTYAIAIGTAILLALTLLPVLAWKLIPEQTQEKEPIVMRALHRVYDPLLDFSLRRPWIVISFRAVIIVAAFVLFPLLGGEFMPKLEEGNLWIRATLPMSISLTQSAQYTDRMRNIIKGCPTHEGITCVRSLEDRAMLLGKLAPELLEDAKQSREPGSKGGSGVANGSGGSGSGPGAHAVDEAERELGDALERAPVVTLDKTSAVIGATHIPLDAPDLDARLGTVLSAIKVGVPATQFADVVVLRCNPATKDRVLDVLVHAVTSAGFHRVLSLQTHPEVIATTSQLGRPDDGTDVTGYFNIEFFAPLIPLDDFPRGLTKDALIDQINDDLHAQFPSVTINFSQMIGDNVEEALAGIKGENSIKVFGHDLQENEKSADIIIKVLNDVKGVADLGKFTSLGQPDIKITPDRQAVARYGLNSGDIVNVVTTAIGGAAVTQLFEREKSFDVVVRWAEPYRSSLEAIREIQVATPDGLMIPLSELATIELLEGPSNIYREDGERYTPVKFSVRGRDLESTVNEAQQKIAPKIPEGYGKRLVWAGTINELRDAQHRLLFIVPLTLLIVIILVYAAVRSWLATAIVMIDIPIACTGGLLALLLTGTNFSVSAAMGLLSIFGIAIQDAILVVTYFQRQHYVEHKTTREAAREAAEKRFRPVLMTTLVATLGLMPAAVSHGIGSQTQKPLAIAVIGGSIILAILTRIIQPPLLVVAHDWWDRRRVRKGQKANPFVPESEEGDHDLGRITSGAGESPRGE